MLLIVKLYYLKKQRLNLKSCKTVKFSVENTVINDKLRDTIFNTKRRIEKFFKFNATVTDTYSKLEIQMPHRM